MMADLVPQTNNEDLRDCSFYWNSSFLFKGKASISGPEESISKIFGDKFLEHYKKGILRIEFDL